jgi:RNA polymerase sigma-70 factor (ECF subfamily)
MRSEQSTSVSLLERLHVQDADAWRRLLSLYGPLIEHWCGHWGVRGADAEDVRQEVLQAVSANLGQFRRDRPGDTFRGWLRGITRNKLLDHFRRRQSQPAAEGGSDAHLQFQQFPQPETPLPDDSAKQLSDLYHRALELIRGEFEERTWRAFWRVAVEGHTPAEVAGELGVTPAAIRKAKSRVLRRLKEEAGELIV